jgi:hypothetical protein
MRRGVAHLAEMMGRPRRETRNNPPPPPISKPGTTEIAVTASARRAQAMPPSPPVPHIGSK